jgi:uncharacterized membrane protein HdeD (DUF308 family)
MLFLYKGLISMDTKQNYQLTKDAQRSTEVFGAVQVVLGIAVIIVAAFATWLSVWIIAVSLAIWGILDLIHVLKQKNIWWRYPLGILALCGGVLLMIKPGIGSAAISLLLSFLFLVGGINAVLISVKQPDGRGWIAAGGILSLLLGVLILSMWPVTSFILLGVLTGVEILLNGWTLTITGMTRKNAKTEFFHRGRTA